MAVPWGSLLSGLAKTGLGAAAYGVVDWLTGEREVSTPGPWMAGYGYGGQQLQLPSGFPSGGPVALPGGTPAAGGGNGMAMAMMACSQPFAAHRAGTGIRAVAQVHALVNPVSGRLQWFGPGRIRFIPNRARRRGHCRPR